jgi:hypothetical protein
MLFSWGDRFGSKDQLAKDSQNGLRMQIQEGKKAGKVARKMNCRTG